MLDLFLRPRLLKLAVKCFNYIICIIDWKTYSICEVSECVSLMWTNLILSAVHGSLCGFMLCSTTGVECFNCSHAEVGSRQSNTDLDVKFPISDNYCARKNLKMFKTDFIFREQKKKSSLTLIGMSYESKKNTHL